MKRIIIFALLVIPLLASCGNGPSAGIGNHEPDSEHLAILKQGVDSWNEWRSQNVHVIPDLENADLNQANLENYNLFKAILSNANLVNADLKGADLTNANLRGADLSMADLSGTTLTGTKYDSRTKWPEGFDPVAAGAKLVAQ